MKRIAILGSTGSIGQSALAVVDAHADRLQVVGLAAGENAELLAAQIARYRPRVAAMAIGRGDRSADAARRARRRRRSPAPGATASSPSRRIPTSTSCCARRRGTDGARGGARGDRARQDDRARQQGSARHGRRHRHRRGARGTASPILPVDSEHNAIHQCLHGRDRGRGAAADPDRVGRTVSRPLGV